MNEAVQYSNFIRPDWAPPSWVFGPVWSVLYTIIFISFGVIFYKSFKKQISFSVALPFILNLIFNFLFTPIQFGLKNNFLASIDILLVVGTLVWGMWVVCKKAPKLKWAVYANIPYLLWGLFATVLQLTITYLNM
jgi:translocator protein